MCIYLYIIFDMMILPDRDKQNLGGGGIMLCYDIKIRYEKKKKTLENDEEKEEKKSLNLKNGFKSLMLVCML